MPTTVQVDDDTRRRLESLRNEKRMDSYDDVIRWLMASEGDLPESIFGAAKGSHRFRRETEDEHEP